MKLQIADLKDDRQWAAVTGCQKVQFQKLLILFQASYLEMYGKTVVARQAEFDIPQLAFRRRLAVVQLEVRFDL